MAFCAGLGTESLGRSGTETVSPASFLPLKNHSALRGEEDTSTILASFGEGGGEKTEIYKYFTNGRTILE